MKRIFFILAFLCSSIGFAEQLHDFNQIKKAVTAGKLIRIFVDYTKCSLPIGQAHTVPNNAAVFTPNAMALTKEGKIGASILYFTMKDPRYPNKAVYQYGRYILAPDNSLNVTFSVLNPSDYTELEGNSSIDCIIDEGAKIFVNETAISVKTMGPGLEIC